MTVFTAAISPTSSSAAAREQGGLITFEDLAKWKPLLEEPVMTTYKGIEVYKLSCWVQGPVMLQALNMLENLDLRAMGLNSVRYIHTLYQVMNLVFADRDFYYGDPYFPPEEPLKGFSPRNTPANGCSGSTGKRTIPTAARVIPTPSKAKTIPGCHLLVSHELKRARRPRIFAAWNAKDPGEFFDRHDLDPGLRPGRMGGLGHAQRRLDPGLHRRPHRYRHEPAGAEFRPGRKRKIPSMSSLPAKDRGPP